MKTYTGEPLKILGERKVTVGYKDQSCKLPVVVVAGDGPALFGLNWLEQLTLDWGSIKTMRMDLEKLLQKHEALFRN